MNILIKKKPDMTGIIIDLQGSDTWKTQLTIAINFISWKDTEEERVIYSTRKNIKSTTDNKANEVINELSESLCSKFQWEEVILFLIQFNICITNVIK